MTSMRAHRRRLMGVLACVGIVVAGCAYDTDPDTQRADPLDTTTTTAPPGPSTTAPPGATTTAAPDPPPPNSDGSPTANSSDGSSPDDTSDSQPTKSVPSDTANGSSPLNTSDDSVPSDTSEDSVPAGTGPPTGSTTGETIIGVPIPSGNQEAPPPPPDCVPLPPDGPTLIVTTVDGRVFSSGPNGTQLVATSDGLPGTITSAWRGSGGALWVLLTLDLFDYAVGRLDGGAFTESISGDVILQHVGTVEGEAAAAMFDYDAGDVIVETAAGEQLVVAATEHDGTRAHTAGMGADVVAIDFEDDFVYVDVEGNDVDWYNPTDDPARDGRGVTFVTPSPVSDQLAWLESDGEDASSGPWDLVVVDAVTGDELRSIPIGEDGDRPVAGDWDGRWFALTVGEGTVPLLVDVDAESPEAFVPCVPEGEITLDRSGGGGQPDDSPDSVPGGGENPA